MHSSSRPTSRVSLLAATIASLLMLAFAFVSPQPGAAAPSAQESTPIPSPTFTPYEPAGQWSAVHGPGVDLLWGPIEAPTLNGVHVVRTESGGMDGWVVGDECALARFDGTEWTRDTALESLCGGLTHYDLRDVYVRSVDDVWAVGRVIGGSGAFARDCVAADPRNIDRDEGCGFMMHFDGGSWRLLNPFDYGVIRVAAPLNAIDMKLDEASGEWQGWVVGNNATYSTLKAIILQFNHEGDRWAVTGATTNLIEHLRDVRILSATDAWMVGDSGTESRYQIGAGDSRGQWRRLGLSGRDHLYAVDLTERDFGWDGGWRGRMNRYDGNCDDDDDTTPCWFDNQAFPIRNADGNQLTTIDVLAIDLLDLGVGWLAGLSDGRRSTIAYLSVENWHVAPVGSDPGRDLHGLFMYSESRGWAVGEDGTILEYAVAGPTETPGPTATETSSPTSTATETTVPSETPVPTATLVSSATPPASLTPTDPTPTVPTPPVEPTPTPTTFPDVPTPTPTAEPSSVPSVTPVSQPIYLPWTVRRRPRTTG